MSLALRECRVSQSPPKSEKRTHGEGEVTAGAAAADAAQKTVDEAVFVVQNRDDGL